MKTPQPVLSVVLLALFAATASAQAEDPGLPPPGLRPATAPAEERVLSGQLEWINGQGWDLGEYWLVTADGQRYHVPRKPRSRVVGEMSHGWLKAEQLTIRAEVTRVSGVLTARATELLNPAARELRATVRQEEGTLILDTAQGPLRVREVFHGSTLVRHLLGSTVMLRAYVFEDGTALVKAVQARARGWHFQPVVLPAIIIPRWRRPGTEYWINYWGQNEEPAVGTWSLAAEALDFDPTSEPEEAATPAPEPQAGIADALPE